MSMMSRRGLEEEPAPVRTKPSQSQQEKLLELFAAKPWLCAGPPRSGYARDRNRAAWQDIAAELNADLSGCHKTWKRWAKVRAGPARYIYLKRCVYRKIQLARALVHKFTWEPFFLINAA